MKKINLFVKLGLLIALFLSCEINSSVESSKTINVNTKIATNDILLSTIANYPKYVKLYTDSVFLIGDVRQIKYEDKIYVQNFQKILVFNSDGSPCYAIDKQGKSGTEYYEINDFHIDKIDERIEVWDRVKKQMMFFNNKSGEFIESKKWDIDAYYFKKINQNYFFYSRASYSEKGEKSSRIICVNKDGVKLNEFLKSDYIKLYAFGSAHFLSSLNNELFYNDAPLSVIYRINENNCTHSYKINIDNKTMSLDEFLDMKDLRADVRDNKMMDTYSYSTGIFSLWDSGMYFEVRSNGNWYNCFYYFENSKINIGTGLFDDYSLNLKVWFSNICDNKIICYLPAYQIKKGMKNNSEFNKNFKNLTSSDNPVLLIGNLKQL